MAYKEDGKVDVLTEQVKHLFNSYYSAGFANIGLAAIFFFLVIDSAIVGYATFWFVGMVVITIALVAVSFFLQNKINNDNARGLLKIYFGLGLVLSIAWGFIYILQYQLGDPDVRIFTFIAYLGLISTSTSIVMAWFPALVAFIFPQLTILLVVLILEEDGASDYIAMAAIVYSLLMLILGKKINHNLVVSLELQAINMRLVDNLNGEIGEHSQIQKELERQQSDLEKIVDERTQELVQINTSLHREIDDRQEAEKSLRYVEQYDQLTNLPNRALLLDRIGHTISTSARERWMVAVLFLGIDQFKKINNSFGHGLGDKLLQQVANRLKLLLREDDTVARNSGDEFVVVLEHVEQAHVAETVTRKMIASLNEMFVIMGHDLHIDVSIGIAIAPFDGEDPQKLLESAGTAMHRAKQVGGSRYEFYAEEMSHEIRERLNMENRLRFAVARGEFFMAYQPQVDSVTGKTVGFEALIRWESPEFGLIEPNKFIPLLEESNMIHSVGEWIIKNVVRFIHTGGSQGHRVSINLSARQCSQPHLGDFIQSVVDEYEIDPSMLEFELTESILLDDFKRARALVNRLQEMGCTIALDDFGIGYTSMGYLTQLNIDVIKIDRSFVTEIHRHDNLRKIVYAIIGMSQSLEIENVIEGVENSDELAAIEALGGHIIQGFIYSKPLRPGKELNDWLAASG